MCMRMLNIRYGLRRSGAGVSALLGLSRVLLDFGLWGSHTAGVKGLVRGGGGSYICRPIDV